MQPNNSRQFITGIFLAAMFGLCVWRSGMSEQCIRCEWDQSPPPRVEPSFQQAGIVSTDAVMVDVPFATFDSTD